MRRLSAERGRASGGLALFEGGVYTSGPNHGTLPDRAHTTRRRRSSTLDRCAHAHISTSRDDRTADWTGRMYGSVRRGTTCARPSEERKRRRPHARDSRYRTRPRRAYRVRREKKYEIWVTAQCIPYTYATEKNRRGTAPKNKSVYWPSETGALASCYPRPLVPPQLAIPAGTGAPAVSAAPASWICSRDASARAAARAP